MSPPQPSSSSLAGRVGQRGRGTDDAPDTAFIGGRTITSFPEHAVSRWLSRSLRQLHDGHLRTLGRVMRPSWQNNRLRPFVPLQSVIGDGGQDTGMCRVAVAGVVHSITTALDATDCVPRQHSKYIRQRPLPSAIGTTSGATTR